MSVRRQGSCWKERYSSILKALVTEWMPEALVLFKLCVLLDFGIGLPPKDFGANVVQISR